MATLRGDIGLHRQKQNFSTSENSESTIVVRKKGPNAPSLRLRPTFRGARNEQIHIVLLLLLFSLVTTGSASADTFVVNATLSSGMLAGTIDIDTASGSILGQNLTVTYQGKDYAFTSPPSCVGDCFGGDNHFTALFVDDASTELFLGVIPTTLVGFTGSPLCSIYGNANCNGYGSDFYIGSFDDRVVHGAVSMTPEPSTFALFGSGILSLAGFARKRKASSVIRHTI